MPEVAPGSLQTQFAAASQSKMSVSGSALVGLALTGAGAIASALISYAVKQLAIRVVVNLASNVAADLLTGKSLGNSLDSRLTGESLLFGVVQSPVQSVVSAASGVLAYHAAKALGGSESQGRTAQFAAGLAAGLVTPGSFSKGGAAGKGPGATGSTAGTSGRGAQSGTRSASSGSGQAKAPSAPVKPPSPGAPAGSKPTPATAPNTPAPKPNTGPNGPQTATQGCPPGSTGCFVAGTPFLTPLGQMKVEDFDQGYEILTRDEFNPDAPVEFKKVDVVFRRTAAILRVMVSGRVLKTTHEHPFYVVGEGWRHANELQVGDRLLSHNESLGVVESVEDRSEVGTVYNLTVSGYHTYFVGERSWGFSVWAHNYPPSGGGTGGNGGNSAPKGAPGAPPPPPNAPNVRPTAPPATVPPAAPSTPNPFPGGHTSGTQKPPITGATPNSIYTHIDPKTGRAVQNAIYDANGNVIGHVDFKNHGPGAVSGHGHQFPQPGNPASGHGAGKPHIPNNQLPPGWDDLPSGVQPQTPIGQ